MACASPGSERPRRTHRRRSSAQQGLVRWHLTSLARLTAHGSDAEEAWTRPGRSALLDSCPGRPDGDRGTRRRRGLPLTDDRAGHALATPAGAAHACRCPTTPGAATGVAMTCPSPTRTDATLASAPTAMACSNCSGPADRRVPPARSTEVRVQLRSRGLGAGSGSCGENSGGRRSSCATCIWGSILAPIYLQLLEGLRRVSEGKPGATWCRECGQPVRSPHGPVAPRSVPTGSGCATRAASTASADARDRARAMTRRGPGEGSIYQRRSLGRLVHRRPGREAHPPRHSRAEGRGDARWRSCGSKSSRAPCPTRGRGRSCTSGSTT